MPTLVTSVNHNFGNPSHSNQRSKRGKRNPDWKKVKLPLSGDDIILYIEYPRDATRKLIEFINETGKVAGYKLKHRNLLYFYILTTEDQKEKLKKQSH